MRAVPQLSASVTVVQNAMILLSTSGRAFVSLRPVLEKLGTASDSS
jgi:hypothetical protein